MVTDSYLIFCPDDIFSEDLVYLFGLFEVDVSNSGCRVFYILYGNNSPELIDGSSNKLLGLFSRDFSEIVPVQKVHWFELSNSNNLGRTSCLPHLTKVILNEKSVNINKCRLIMYDKKSFASSELLLLDSTSESECCDQFKKLSHHIQNLPKNNTNNTLKGLNFVLESSIGFVSVIFTVILKVFFLLKYSNFGLHVKESIENFLWVLNSIRESRRIKLEVGNYILAVFLDIVMGIIVLNYLTDLLTNGKLFEIASLWAEEIFNSIIVLVEWLMGSPAGLKLNHPLNQVIGGFFLYNIKLWFTFLVLISPVLKYGLVLFTQLGFLGLTFQLAIVTDTLLLVTFHAYCIYIYAARLYEVQVRGLWTLSRLVLGRKRNPLPGRIDSCPYTTEQLFVGTISFTVLLFLLPTVLVYYIVFVFLRLCFKSLCGLIIRLRCLVQLIPAYVVFLWFFAPSSTASTLEIWAERSRQSDIVIAWRVKAVPRSLYKTVALTLPSCVRPPSNIGYSQIIQNVTLGKII